MNLSQRAGRTAKDIVSILGASPSAEQSDTIRGVLERAFIDVVLAEQERCASVAKKHCASDQDMAHKLATEMRQEREALIANLSAMR